jgi:hypothetical protein
MSMRITTRWLDRGEGTLGAEWEPAADSATLAELELAVADTLFTRAEDTLSGEIRQHAVLPANRMAEWLVWNWWRLCWEPRRTGKQQVPGWLESHRLANAGGGWLWPNVEFASDGVRMRLHATPSAAVPSQPLRYLSSDSAVIPVAGFESAVADFVAGVCRRLTELGQPDADLPQMWEELQAERADPELSLYRRLEALLGYDPDECPGELIQAMRQDAAALGVEAITELAAGAGSAPLSARQLREWAVAQGTASRIADRVGWMDKGVQVDRQLPAWRNGVMAAHALRAQERLGDEPLSDQQLAEWFAIPQGLLRDDRHHSALAYELVEPSDQSRVVLRSRWQAGRRFEVSRLLGDTLLQAQTEPLHLATAQNTYRQKLQRAFAAELLCPIEALKALLKDDFSDDAIQGAADLFGVSPMTVTVQLLNNDVLERDELDGLDLDMAVA